jgi:23S rRNA (guanosine2251-2'-O)-methyltransferase
MAETASPQGVVASVAPYRYYELREIPAPEAGRVPFILALDGVEDPRNLGSLLRVADAAGADFVIIPKRRSAHVTAAVAKASAGAVEHVRIARVSNVSSALLRLKEDGFWVVGAESESGVAPWELDLAVPLVVVLGGEGGGMGRLVRERCDHLVSLPMNGKVSSLNVANAGAVLLYEALRQRTEGNPHA